MNLFDNTDETLHRDLMASLKLLKKHIDNTGRICSECNEYVPRNGHSKTCKAWNLIKKYGADK